MLQKAVWYVKMGNVIGAGQVGFGGKLDGKPLPHGFGNTEYSKIMRERDALNDGWG